MSLMSRLKKGMTIWKGEGAGQSSAGLSTGAAQGRGSRVSSPLPQGQIPPCRGQKRLPGPGCPVSGIHGLKTTQYAPWGRATRKPQRRHKLEPDYFSQAPSDPSAD